MELSKAEVTTKLPERQRTASLLPSQVRQRSLNFNTFALFSASKPLSHLKPSAPLVTSQTFKRTKDELSPAKELANEFSNELLREKGNPRSSRQIRLTRQSWRPAKSDFMVNFVEGKNRINKMLRETAHLMRTESAHAELVANVRRTKQPTTRLRSSRNLGRIDLPSELYSSLPKLQTFVTEETRQEVRPSVIRKELDRYAALKKCFISCKELELGSIPVAPSGLVTEEELVQLISFRHKPQFRFK